MQEGKKDTLVQRENKNKRVTTLCGGSLALHGWGDKQSKAHTYSFPLIEGGHNERWLSTTPVNITNLSFLLFPFIPQELRASLGSNFQHRIVPRL